MADEPTGNLDSKSAEGIAGLLKEISKDKLVIVVTHNAEYFGQYSTREICIHDGGIVSDEKKEEEEIETAEWEEAKKEPCDAKRNVLWLGSLNYKSRPKFTILMSAILLTFSIALFAIVSIFADQIRRPLRQSVSQTPINGKAIIKDVTGRNITDDDMKKLVKETKANYVFKNNVYSEIVSTIESEGNTKEIKFIYDPYKYTLKENEAVLQISYSLRYNVVSNSQRNTLYFLH